MLSSPAYDGDKGLHKVSTIENMRTLALAGYRTMLKDCTGHPLLHVARGNVVGTFWASGADWLVMSDSDMGFGETLLRDMVDWGRKHDKYMLAAIAPLKIVDVERA